MFNFNKAIFPGTQGGPLEHVIAAKAVCFKEALEPEFKEYQQQILKNAQALCKGLMQRGVKIVSGGTDNHLMLVDLSKEEVTGKELEKRLDDAHITCNKNTIPNEPRSPFVTRRHQAWHAGSHHQRHDRGRYGRYCRMYLLVLKSEEDIGKARRMVAGLTEKYPLC